jgi:hypothetical protein
MSYGSIDGDAGVYQISHVVTLSSLTPLTKYHFMIKADDIYDNEGDSADGTFTLSDSGSDLTELYIGTTTASTVNNEAPLSADDSSLLEKIKDASASMVKNILASLFSNKNMTDVSESDVESTLSALAAKAVSSPTISGTDVVVETGSNSATIKWTTDKPANSMVSYATDDQYAPSQTDPYTITSGNPDEQVTDHTVTLSNLDPKVSYHFQVQSKGEIGPSGVSSDKTFTTSSAVPEIDNMHFDQIGEDNVKLSWKTDAPTKASIDLKNMQTGEVKDSQETGYEVDHQLSLQNLDFSTPYTVSLIASDANGASSVTSILPFSTVPSGKAPTISGLKITTSLIPDKVEVAQTIISWKTDKPATSQVSFGLGNVADLPESTQKDISLVRDHIVITTALSPGTVYKIVAQSGDSSGNVTKSEPYTVLTPAPKGSVIDIMIANFQKTFGFLNK